MILQNFWAPGRHQASIPGDCNVVPSGFVLVLWLGITIRTQTGTTLESPSRLYLDPQGT